MTTDTTEHRYRASALAGDYAKAATGLALSAAPLALAEPALGVSAVLWALVALFAAHGARTYRRQRARFMLSPDSLSDGRVTLAFGELSALRLRHFSVLRADRDSGWMELRLGAPGGRIRVESGLEGFTDIARRAAEAARLRGIGLDRATIANLRAMGLDEARDGKP